MAVIPTLHSGPTQVLKNKDDIVAYIIRHSLMNPGFTSSFIEGRLISFRKLEAEYETDREGLAEAYSSKLKIAFQNLFPDDNISVTVDTYDIDDAKYGLTINVTDTSAVPLVVSGKIEVSDGDIDIEFGS